jgi:hypothetical protein
MAAPEFWVDVLTEHLPYHQDQFFLRLQAAVFGAYKPQVQDPADSEPPKTKEGAVRRVFETARRHARAIATYKRGR